MVNSDLHEVRGATGAAQAFDKLRLEPRLMFADPCKQLPTRADLARDGSCLFRVSCSSSPQEVPMKPKALVMIATLIALALPLAMSAQEKKDAAEMSVTGCFHKGDDEGHYVITDGKTGKKITVTGEAGMLASHAKSHGRSGHKVTITGSMIKEKDKDVLKASKLQMWWTSLAWPCDRG
jgi:hypothetical protein